MKSLFSLTLIIFLLFSCNTNLKTAANQFNTNNDAQSLQQVVELFPLHADTAELTKLLGIPTLKTPFDFRFLLDSVSENRCPVGGVFHYNEKGQIDQKWIGEICE